MQFNRKLSLVPCNGLKEERAGNGGSTDTISSGVYDKKPADIFRGLSLTAIVVQEIKEKKRN